jgi:hypothetical protein
VVAPQRTNSEALDKAATEQSAYELRIEIEKSIAQGRASDPIARTAEYDPIRTEALLGDFSEFRLRHRTARPLPANIQPGDGLRPARVSS